MFPVNLLKSIHSEEGSEGFVDFSVFEGEKVELEDIVEKKIVYSCIKGRSDICKVEVFINGTKMSPNFSTVSNLDGNIYEARKQMKRASVIVEKRFEMLNELVEKAALFSKNTGQENLEKEFNTLKLDFIESESQLPSMLTKDEASEEVMLKRLEQLLKEEDNNEIQHFEYVNE